MALFTGKISASQDSTSVSFDGRLPTGARYVPPPRCGCLSNRDLRSQTLWIIFQKHKNWYVSLFAVRASR
jgi:hypothetical protein